MIRSSLRFGAALVFAIGGLVAVSTPARAASIQYRIDADTSSIAGQSVNLFFAASGTNDGPGSATGNVVVVSNFTSDAVLQHPATPFGLTTGDLPGTVTLPFTHDDPAGNYRPQYDIAAVLGNHLSFEISLAGDQLDGTNVVPYAGFEFSVFQGLSYVWLGPSGFASAEVYQANGVLGFESVPQITITPIPEPAALGLLAAGGLGLLRRRRRRNR